MGGVVMGVDVKTTPGGEGGRRSLVVICGGQGHSHVSPSLHQHLTWAWGQPPTVLEIRVPDIWEQFICEKHTLLKILKKQEGAGTPSLPVHAPPWYKFSPAETLRLTVLAALKLGT